MQTTTLSGLFHATARLDRAIQELAGTYSVTDEQGTWLRDQIEDCINACRAAANLHTPLQEPDRDPPSKNLVDETMAMFMDETAGFARFMPLGVPE